MRTNEVGVDQTVSDVGLSLRDKEDISGTLAGRVQVPPQ